MISKSSNFRPKIRSLKQEERLIALDLSISFSAERLAHGVAAQITGEQRLR